MDKSVFTRVFSYRQRENHSPLENFLTEILAYCLEADIQFRKDFLNNALKINYVGEDINISTQEVYFGYGRPDIEINFGNTCIIIECKIGNIEREHQLLDYALLLTKVKKQRNKHLIYLTKYFDYKELAKSNIQPELVRWFEVYESIDETHTEVTQQLKNFLKEQEMENLKNFTLQDLIALNTIPETISKMEELIKVFEPGFLKRFGKFYRQKNLSENLYNIHTVFKYQSKDYFLFIGFYWYDDIDIPFFGLSLYLPQKKFDNLDIINIFKNELQKKYAWEYDDEISFSKIKPISDFITGDEDCIPAMKEYGFQGLETVYKLKNKFPRLFKK